MAELMARYPMTPERAASNARILGEEVAAWEAGHPEFSDEELAEPGRAGAA
jgi:hypothetical protein